MGSVELSAASSGRSRGGCSRRAYFGRLATSRIARHHVTMFRMRLRRQPVLTRAEMNGLIMLLMSIDANVGRIADEKEEEDGEGEA